jgi:hypothetical protein
MAESTDRSAPSPQQLLILVICSYYGATNHHFQKDYSTEKIKALLDHYRNDHHPCGQSFYLFCALRAVGATYAEVVQWWEANYTITPPEPEPTPEPEPESELDNLEDEVKEVLTPAPKPQTRGDSEFFRFAGSNRCGIIPLHDDNDTHEIYDTSSRQLPLLAAVQGFGAMKLWVREFARDHPNRHFLPSFHRELKAKIGNTRSRAR